MATATNRLFASVLTLVLAACANQAVPQTPESKAQPTSTPAAPATNAVPSSVAVALPSPSASTMGSGPRATPESSPGVTGNAAKSGQAQLGGTIYFAQQQVVFQIYGVHPASGSVIKVTSEGNNFNPAVSPDGRWLAFATYPSSDTSVSEISIFDLNTGKPKLTTRLNSLSLYPSWSPDATRLVFHSKRREESRFRLIQLTIADSSTAELLVDGLKDSTGRDYNKLYPAFSSDGRLFFSTDREGGLGIFSTSSNGKDLRPVSVVASSLEQEPAVSPDARKIAFTSTRGSDRTTVYLADIDGSNPRALAPLNVTSTAPSFSPDGRHVAMIVQQRNLWQVVVAGVENPDERVVIYDSLQKISTLAWGK